MGRQLIHAFIRRKEWRMMRAKNKLTTPSLTFPFAINLNKAGNLVEKEDMINMVSGRFPKCSMTKF